MAWHSLLHTIATRYRPLLFCIATKECSTFMGIGRMYQTGCTCCYLCVAVPNASQRSQRLSHGGWDLNFRHALAWSWLVRKLLFRAGFAPLKFNMPIISMIPATK